MLNVLYLLVLARTKNGIEVGSGGRTRVKEDDGSSTLYITDLYEKDAGEIVCEIFNALGRETCKANLEVQSRHILAPARNKEY